MLPLPFHFATITTRLNEYELLAIFKKMTVSKKRFHNTTEPLSDDIAFIGKIESSNLSVRPIKEYFNSTQSFDLKMWGRTEVSNEGTVLKLTIRLGLRSLFWYLLILFPGIVKLLEVENFSTKVYLVFIIVVIQSLLLIPFMIQSKKVLNEINYRILEKEP